MNLKTISARFGIPPYVLPIFIVVGLLVVCLTCFLKADQSLEFVVYAIMDDGETVYLGSSAIDELRTLTITEKYTGREVKGLAYLPVAVFANDEGLDGKNLFWQWKLCNAQNQVIFYRPSSTVDGSYYSRDWYGDYNNEKYFKIATSKGTSMYYCEDPLTKGGYSSCAGDFYLTLAGGNRYYPIVLVFDDQWFRDNWNATGCTGSEAYYIQTLDLSDGNYHTFKAYATTRLMEGGNCLHAVAGSVDVTIKYERPTYTFSIQWAPVPIFS